MTAFKPLTTQTISPAAPATRRQVLKTCLTLAAATVGPTILTSCKAAATPRRGRWIDLFDGHTLEGWHTNAEKIGHGTGGLWTVENGAIVGQQDPPGSGNGGILLTDQKFGNFELVIDFKPDWGPDSGLFLRSNDQGQCFQVMLDYHEQGNVGHVYGEGSGGFLARPFDLYGQYAGQAPDRKLIGFTSKPRDDWKPEYAAYTCTAQEWIDAWKLNGWNRMRVRCVGRYPRITTWVNGLKVCDFNGETCPHPQYDRQKVLDLLGPEGSIALQVHGGVGSWEKGLVYRWRNLRIKSL